MVVSHFSPLSSTPFPQPGEQSLSLPLLQPVGQQPSPSVQVLIATKEHCAEQPPPPSSASSVHEFWSSQAVGQAPGWPAAMPVSQASLSSSLPLPQSFEQSLSPAAVQPLGQHPSPSLQLVIGSNVQLAAQVPPASSESSVQARPSSQLSGQAPAVPTANPRSQRSPSSSLPLPQFGSSLPRSMVFAPSPVGVTAPSRLRSGRSTRQADTSTQQIRQTSDLAEFIRARTGALPV
jgi:hypothetical protein